MSDVKNVVPSEVTTNKVISIYESTVGIQNVVNEIQKLDDNYFKNNWSVGLSNLSYDLEHILSIMGDIEFSFDYQQALTFMSYVRIFDFLTTKMKDDLTVYDEGIEFVKLIIKNLSSAVKPYVAFVCSRVRDLNLVSKIPAALLGTYRKYEEEGIDELMKVDLSNIFEFAFPEEEDVYDDVYIDEVKDNLSKMFGDNYDMSDFESISSILYEYTKKQSARANIDLDF